MNFVESQRDMKSAYVGGATGLLASGLVWLMAGIIGLFFSSTGAIIALFIGGMFIFPLSVVFAKMLSASGKHADNNVLRHLALETLPMLFCGLLIGLYIAQSSPQLFFPIMLLTIGARYFAFHTLYGLVEYWVVGALLFVAGILCVLFDAPLILGAFVGALLEITFASVIYVKSNPTKNRSG